ncbi:hypothetical protein AAC387_Pa07g0322 [Persea americana]
MPSVTNSGKWHVYKEEQPSTGEIFSFYRPKVDREEAHGVDDHVQRLYIVSHPESGERPIEEKQASDSGKEGAKGASKAVTGKGKASEKGRKEGGRRSSGKTSEKGSEGGHGSEEVNIEKQPLLRFLIIGKKRLPDPIKRGLPHWGFVYMVTTKIDIKTALQGEYDTATRGHTRKPPARALGEGVYRILRHFKGKKMHTHLIYKLELPPEDKKDEPQESLNIERKGSFIIQMKYPEQETSKRFRGLQKSKRRAVFPAHLQGVFGQCGYAPADPPDQLNYAGCEFLLISASDDIDEELGLDIKTEGESNRSCSDLRETVGGGRGVGQRVIERERQLISHASLLLIVCRKHRSTISLQKADFPRLSWKSPQMKVMHQRNLMCVQNTIQLNFAQLSILTAIWVRMK